MMYRRLAIVLVQLLTALTVHAHQWVASDVAVSVVKRFFAAPNVWVFSPEDDHPVYVALSAEDRVSSAALVEEAVRGGGDEIFRCWMPHHGFADAADGSGTVLMLCYHCRRGALVKNEVMTWFTIDPGAESEINALFRRYHLRGSQSGSNKNAGATLAHDPCSRMIAASETRAQSSHRASAAVLP